MALSVLCLHSLFPVLRLSLIRLLSLPAPSDCCLSQGRPWPLLLSLRLESWLPAPVLAAPPGFLLFSRPPPPGAPWALSLPSSSAPLTPRGLVQAPDPNAVGSQDPSSHPQPGLLSRIQILAAATSESPLDTAGHPAVRAPPAPPRLRQLSPPSCLGHSSDNSPGAHPVQRKSCPLHLQNTTRIRLFRPLSPCELCVNLPAPPHSHFPCRFFSIRRVYYFLCHLLVPYMCFFCLIPLKCKLDDVRDFCSQVYSCRVVLFSANSGRSPV